MRCNCAGNFEWHLGVQQLRWYLKHAVATIPTSQAGWSYARAEIAIAKQLRDMLERHPQAPRWLNGATQTEPASTKLFPP